MQTDFPRSKWDEVGCHLGRPEFANHPVQDFRQLWVRERGLSASGHADEKLTSALNSDEEAQMPP